MKISVITATSRRGYLPVIARALANQTMLPTDFEWIIVDDHAEKQAAVVSQIARECLFNIFHCPPETIEKHYAPAAARNQGFHHSKGELIYYCNEYMLPGPTTLERHWALFQEHGPKILLSGRIIEPNPHCRITLSPDRVKIDEGWRPDFDFLDADHVHPETRHREYACKTKVNPDLFEIPETTWWWAGRNDSLPRFLAKSIIQFHVEHPMENWKGRGPENEAFDGGYGYPDQQLAEEASMIFKAKYLFDTLAPAMEIPHARGLGKPMLRVLSEQQALAAAFAKERKEILDGVKAESTA